MKNQVQHQISYSGNLPESASARSEASAGNEIPVLCFYLDGETNCECDECKERCWFVEIGDGDCECRDCVRTKAAVRKDREINQSDMRDFVYWIFNR